MNRLRVVIVDDEPLARRGIRQLLAGEPDVEVAGEARHGQEGGRLVNCCRRTSRFSIFRCPSVTDSTCCDSSTLDNGRS